MNLHPEYINNASFFSIEHHLKIGLATLDPKLTLNKSTISVNQSTMQLHIEFIDSVSKSKDILWGHLPKTPYCKDNIIKCYFPLRKTYNNY